MSATRLLSIGGRTALLKVIRKILQSVILHYLSLRKACTDFFENEKKLKAEGKDEIEPGAQIALLLFIFLWLLAFEIDKHTMNTMTLLTIFFIVIIAIIYGIEEYRIAQLKKQYNSLLKTLEKQTEKNK